MVVVEVVAVAVPCRCHVKLLLQVPTIPTVYMLTYARANFENVKVLETMMACLDGNPRHG